MFFCGKIEPEAISSTGDDNDSPRAVRITAEDGKPQSTKKKRKKKPALLYNMI